MAGQDGSSLENLDDVLRVLSFPDEGIIVLDADHKIIALNAAAEQLISAPDTDIIGKDFAGIMAKLDVRKRLLNDAKVVLEDGSARKRESVSADSRDLLHTLAPLRAKDGAIEGVIIRSEDNTQHVKARLSLERVQEMALTVWWEWAIPEDSLRVFAPKNCILGFDPDQFTPTVGYWEEKTHPDDLDEYRQTLDDCLKGRSKEWIIEHRYSDAKGDWRWISTRGFITRWSEDGEPLEMLGTTVNIDSQKKNELELISSKTEAEEARQAAEAANHAKNTFLATMSHELRTPLNPVIGLSEYLKDSDNLTEEQKELLGIIHNRSQDLLRLIEDILDISRIESERLSIQLMPVFVADLINDVLGVYRESCDKKGLQLRLDVAGELSGTRQLDPVRLRQILVNLVGNSVKFTKEGGISVSAEIVDPASHGDSPPMLHVSVCDTGPGIPVEKRDTVFQRFQQIDGSFTTRSQGIGLGLAICKRLAELMGGRIWIDEDYANGTLFHVVLPAPVVAEVPAKNSAGDATDGGGSKRALIVEDDPSSALMLRKVLQSLDYELSIAENGRAAIQACEDQVFEVIFMDVKMPVINGIEVTRILRGKGVTTPIIGTTAYAFASDQVACLEAGMDAWVAKPLHRKDLVNAIASVKNNS